MSDSETEAGRVTAAHAALLPVILACVSRAAPVMEIGRAHV